MEAGQRALRHHLGAVRHQLQAREVVLPVGLAHQQQVDERRRGREQLDPVLLDGRADPLGGAVLDRHHTARVGQDVQQRIHAADVVEEQKRQRAERMPRDPELLEKRDEVVDRRFALSGGPGREEDEPRMELAP